MICLATLWLGCIGAVAISIYSNRTTHKVIVDLPEEISLLDSNDLLKGKWNNDTLMLEFYYPHKCIDSTHKDCDGKCECDGLDCHN